MNSSNYDLRPTSCNFGILSKPDGSAAFRHGVSTVIAAVYGPAEVRPMRELIDRAAVETVYQPKVGQAGPECRTIEKLIGGIAEATIITKMHPHASFTVVIQEVQDDGSLLACCVNAACAALLDACVPMRYIVAAVACVSDNDGNIIVDPTKVQEANSVARHLFVFESRSLSVVSSVTSGLVSKDVYQQCLMKARATSKFILASYREKYSGVDAVGVQTIPK